MLTSRLGWRPRVTIWSSRAGVLVVTGNLITDAGRDLLADLLAGEAGVETAGITHVALGTGDAEPSGDDEQLEDERYRREVERVRDSTGRVTTSTVVPDLDATDFTIREVGWFAGGTSDADSGLLIARVLYERDKSDDESLGIERVDDIEEVDA